MFDLLLLALVGIGTGFLNTMAGGGSMLSVPMMILLGVPSTIANATNRVAILPQNLTAVLAFYRKGFANFKLSLSLAAFTIPGAILGSLLATQFDNKQFNFVLAIIMLLVLVIMSIPQKQIAVQSHVPNTQQKVAGHLAMIAIGFWGGFIHIGVGFLLMPVLNRLMGFDLITTNSHKVFIVLCYMLVSLLVYATQLEINWAYGIALAVGTTTGAWLAANLQIKKGVGVIKMVLNVVIVGFIIKLIFFT